MFIRGKYRCSEEGGGAKGAIITLVSYIDVCTDGKD